jgi:hypothetical protein
MSAMPANREASEGVTDAVVTIASDKFVEEGNG